MRIPPQVCFATVIVFAWHRPYRDASDNTLQLLCQGAIFMALVSKVILASPDVTGTQESATGVLLTVIVFVPPALMVLHAVYQGESSSLDMLPGVELECKRRTAKKGKRVTPEAAARPAVSRCSELFCAHAFSP